MDTIDMILGLGLITLEYLAIAAVFIILIFLVLIAYNMVLQNKLTKARRRVEETMLDLLAEFDAAIDSCNADDQKETLDRFTRLRAEFEQTMEKYYDGSNNNQSVH